MREENKDKVTIRKLLNGRKTKLGAWACFIAGALKMADLWYPLAGRIGDGLFYIGMGIIGIGIWARLRDIFYPAPEGKTAWQRPKIRAPKVRG